MLAPNHAVPVASDSFVERPALSLDYRRRPARRPTSPSTSARPVSDPATRQARVSHRSQDSIWTVLPSKCMAMTTASAEQRRHGRIEDSIPPTVGAHAAVVRHEGSNEPTGPGHPAPPAQPRAASEDPDMMRPTQAALLKKKCAIQQGPRRPERTRSHPNATPNSTSAGSCRSWKWISPNTAP